MDVCCSCYYRIGFISCRIFPAISQPDIRKLFHIFRIDYRRINRRRRNGRTHYANVDANGFIIFFRLCNIEWADALRHFSRIHDQLYRIDFYDLCSNIRHHEFYGLYHQTGFNLNGATPENVINRYYRRNAR